MGFFDESLFGIDMNFDGKKDFLDDILLMSAMEAEEKRLFEDETDDDFEED